MTKNLNIIKHCDGNIWDLGCVAKDFRAGDKVYADTQGGDNPDEAALYYQQHCYGFSENYMKRAQAFVTNSGYTIIPYYHSSINDNARGFGAPNLLVDVNAQKGPNKWGYDIFHFKFIKSRRLDSVYTVMPSPTCRALDKGGYYTDTFMNYLYGQNAEL